MVAASVRCRTRHGHAWLDHLTIPLSRCRRQAEFLRLAAVALQRGSHLCRGGGPLEPHKNTLRVAVDDGHAVAHRHHMNARQLKPCVVLQPSTQDLARLRFQL